MNLAFLFPPLHEPPRTASAKMLPLADAEQTRNYLTQGLKKWRVAAHIDDYRQAADALKQGEMVYQVALRVYDQIIADGQETVQDNDQNAAAQITRMAGKIAAQIALLKTCKVTMQSYASISHAHHLLAAAHLYHIPRQDTDSRSQAEETRLFLKTFEEEEELENQLRKLCIWTKHIPVKDKQVDAAILYVDIKEIDSLAKEAQKANRKAQKIARALNVLVSQSEENEIPKLKVLVVEQYVQAIQNYADCSRRYLEATQACLQAIENPNAQTKASFKAYKDRAVASMEQAVVFRPRKAAKIKLKADQVAQNHLKTLKQKIKPLTAKLPTLPSLPYKSTVKQKVLVGLEKRMPRLTLSINRLACALLTIPCSALDAFYHAFWGTVKLALLILRTGIFACSSGRYGLFLQDHVSITQVKYHAKSSAYYLANMILGPFIGAYDPERLLRLQARFEPKL